MREIKFRSYTPSGMVQIDKIVFKTGMAYFEDVLRYQSFDMDEFPLMQYTGLKDKNGKEIYEGDIVRADDCNPEYEQIEFIEGGFCLTNPLIKGYPMDINSFYPSVGCMLEVVGNIYENPEFLKA